MNVPYESEKHTSLTCDLMPDRWCWQYVSIQRFAFDGGDDGSTVEVYVTEGAGQGVLASVTKEWQE